MGGANQCNREGAAQMLVFVRLPGLKKPARGGLLNTGSGHSDSAVSATRTGFFMLLSTRSRRSHASLAATYTAASYTLHYRAGYIPVNQVTYEHNNVVQKHLCDCVERIQYFVFC